MMLTEISIQYYKTGFYKAMAIVGQVSDVAFAPFVLTTLSLRCTDILYFFSFHNSCFL